jgi:hypothetical protein
MAEQRREIIKILKTNIEAFDKSLENVKGQQDLVKQNVVAMKTHSKSEDAFAAISEYHRSQDKNWISLKEEIKARIHRENLLLERVQTLEEPIPLTAFVMLHQLKEREPFEIQIPEYTPHYLWRHPYSWVFGGKWKVVPKKECVKSPGGFPARDENGEYKVRSVDGTWQIQRGDKEVKISFVGGTEYINYTKRGFIISYYKEGMLFFKVFEKDTYKRTFCIESKTDHRFCYKDEIFIFNEEVYVHDLNGNLLRSFPLGHQVEKTLAVNNDIIYMRAGGIMLAFCASTGEVEVFPEFKDVGKFVFAPGELLFGNAIKTFPSEDGVFTAY